MNEAATAHEHKLRPVIFLYTEATELSEDVRATMIAAGYLPIRVADVNSVRILPCQIGVDPSSIPIITSAALKALRKSSETTSSYVGQFGAELARALLPKSNKP